MADQVLYSGVASVTDLMVKEGLINLDFADVRSIMRGMGKAMMGTGEATGERRAILAAEAAIANPLLDEVSMKGARGLLISITGGNDLTLYEVDEAASRIRQEVDEDANIILGATFNSSLEGVVRVSVVATGIDLRCDHRRGSHGRRGASRRGRRASAQPGRTRRSRAASRACAPIARARRRPMPERSGPTSAAPSYYAEAAQPPPSTHGVYIEPAPRPPDLWRASAVEAPRARRRAAPAPYVPPAPEQPRAPRMPQIEDFPQPIQDQYAPGARRRRPARIAPQVDLRAPRLLRREPSGGCDASAPPRATPCRARAPARRAAGRPQPSPTHAEYGKRPAAPAPQPGRPGHAALDPHGRRAPRRARSRTIISRSRPSCAVRPITDRRRLRR